MKHHILRLQTLGSDGMRGVEEKIITDYEFNHLRSQIVTSNDNLNLKSQFATLEKWDSLRSQNVTIESRCRQRRKYLPYAFSEQGGCTITLHTCKGVHKKAMELCIGAGGTCIVHVVQEAHKTIPPNSRKLEIRPD